MDWKIMFSWLGDKSNFGFPVFVGFEKQIITA